MNEKKRRLYFEIVDKNIQQNGFHVTYVMESKNFSPFGYSTGLYRNFRIPEAFVSGLPNGLTNTLITNYAQIFKDKNVPLNEKLNNLIDRFPIYIISVKSRDLVEQFLSSFRFYEASHFDCVQIIFPDLEGRFPGENGYAYDQEIFGQLPTKG